jgi:thiosulfate/3-mercaptopyruvate sulfurtransferase
MSRSRSLSRSLAAASLFCAALPAGRAAAQGASTQGARDPRAAILVTPAWLAEHLRDPDLLLLHVSDRAEYDRAHIPGARHATMQDIAVGMRLTEGNVLEMPSPDTLRARLEGLGITDRSKVVVYYGKDWVSPSTRIVYTLDYAGLGDRTVLLDGGMQAWQRAGHAVTAEVPARPTTSGRLSALRVRPIVVDVAWVKAHLNAPGFRIIDGRSANFYDGVADGGVRKGHIAGAGSVPFNTVTDDSLRLKSPAELRALFAKAGVAPGDTVVGYCHIGQQATAMLFAARSLGHPVLLYDGSFTEWERLPAADAPVETAPSPARKP